MSQTLLITEFFRPEPGGLESFFTGLARNWKYARLDVCILEKGRYLSSYRERQEFDVKESYRIFRLNPEPARYTPWHRYRNLRIYINDLLSAGNHSHLLIAGLPEAAVRGLFSLQGPEFSVPYSVFIHPMDYKNRLHFYNLRRKTIVRNAHRVFAFSRSISEGLVREIGVKKDKVITMYPSMEPRSDLRSGIISTELYSRIKGRGVILGLGPLVPRKGFEHAVKMMLYLRDMNPPLHLVIAGSGPEYGYLKHLIEALHLEQEVTLTGFLEDREVDGLLHVAHLMIQPGQIREDDEEAMSIALMEASHAGLPVVAGAAGGVQDVIRQGVTGFLTDPGDSFRLSERVRQIFLDKDLRTRMGRDARNHARKEFGMEKTVSLIESSLSIPE